MKPDNIRVMKLSSGDEVIAVINKETNQLIWTEVPIEVVPEGPPEDSLDENAKRVSFSYIPYNAMGEIDKLVCFNRTNVVSMFNPAPSVTERYFNLARQILKDYREGGKGLTHQGEDKTTPNKPVDVWTNPNYVPKSNPEIEMNKRFMLLDFDDETDDLH